MMQEIRKQKNLIEVVETVAQCMSMLRENVEVEGKIHLFFCTCDLYYKQYIIYSYR